MSMFTNLKIWACLLAMAALFAALGSGCRARNSRPKAEVTIQNRGSDTLVHVAQAWAEEYKEARPEVAVEVSGGGSGQGIAALVKGTIDIANSSRNIKPDEAEMVRRNTGKEPVEFKVGYDALAVFVHETNPLEEISFEQLYEIYAEHGKVVNWSDMGVRIPGVVGTFSVTALAMAHRGAVRHRRGRLHLGVLRPRTRRR
jgi:phosphate transport system substrate-binding protein